jgi:TatD DNase family protein
MNLSGSPNSPLIDTHAHLGMPDFELDRDQVVSRATDAGLVAIITVGDQPAEWDRAVEISRAYPIVYAALGIHPNSGDQCNQAALDVLAGRCRLANDSRVVALGEIGLDYFREYVPHDVQKAAFVAQLHLATQLNLPVVIHNRDAHADVLEILKRHGSGTRGVMHSFSGDLDYALQCIELGYLISLSGPVTFRNAPDKHLIAREVPLEFLLVETDCPFLTPEPFRGRRNEPQYVQYTARAIARQRGVDEAEVRMATTMNACRLFGLNLSGLRTEDRGQRTED